MVNECRIQFYFRTEDLKKLLKENPKAKGIIVSQEIAREKPKGAASYVNVARIRARVDMGAAAPAKTAKATNLKKGEAPTPEDGIDGCPFPPGCTP